MSKLAKVKVERRIVETLPRYVRLGPTGSALRLTGGRYYRDAGAWSVGFKKVAKGQLICHVPNPENPMRHANNIAFYECTEQEWREDNRGYLPFSLSENM